MPKREAPLRFIVKLAQATDDRELLRRAFDLVLRVAAKGNPRAEMENRTEKLEIKRGVRWTPKFGQVAKRESRS